MSVDIKRREYGSGISLTEICDPKFKSFTVCIRMVMPMIPEKAPLYSLAADIIATSTRKYPQKEELSRALAELYDASVGSTESRLGDKQIVMLTLNCICDGYTIGGEKVSQKAVRLLLDCLFDPWLENGALSEKYFNLCRADMIDEIDAVVNYKNRYAAVLANKRIFENEMSAISLCDYREPLLSADPASVTEAYYELLKNAYFDVYISGGECDGQTVEMLLSELDKPGRTPYEVGSYLSPSAIKPEVCRAEDRARMNQSLLIMAYKTDSYNEYASKLFCALLGSTPTSKLFSNVREKMSLCYYCSSTVIDMKNTIVVSSGLDEQNLSIAEKAIAEQLEAIQKGDFTDEELENTKTYLAEAYLSNYDSKYQLMIWYNYQFAHGTNDTPEEKGRKIRALTREDIIREAQGYRLDTVFCLKPEDGGDSDEM
ncbi:MAG: insulinase family protein [Ruminococcus sp.]|nr:insulinase family protein [Ruminococcus sp.]